MARRVLFVRNDPSAPEALLGDAFTESGFDVENFEVVPADRADDPVLEAAFPDPTRYDVIVPLGARWPVYDRSLPWVRDEIAMVQRALDSGVGVLGVCFGGQLLAAALGGTVARSPLPEIGWQQVHSDVPGTVPGGPWFQWHFDRFTAPPGATVVARNEAAPQAFRHGRALGLQFHPEVDKALVEKWIDEDAADMTALGIDPAEVLTRTAAMAGDAAVRLRILVRGFLGLLDQPRST